MSSTALQRQDTAIAQRSANPIDALQHRFSADRYIVLAPKTHMAHLPAGTTIAVTEVQVDTNPKKKEVFPISGGDLMLSKVSLDRVAAAAGITWLDEQRRDDRRHPHYCEMFVRGRMTDFDGTVREITGHKIVDLREDAGDGVQGKDYAEIVSKAAQAKPPRDPSGQLMEARKFIAEIAASKAKNRAIASGLGIKRSYSRDDLKRPFIIPKLIPDSSDQATKQLMLAQMLGATSALYGNSRIVDAQLEEVHQNSAPPVEEPEAEDGERSDAPASSSAEPPPLPDFDEEPPHVEDTGEVLLTEEEREERITRAWRKAASQGMVAGAWKKLIKSASGKARMADLTADDVVAIEQSVDAFVANGGA